MFANAYGEDNALTNQVLDLSVFGHLVRNEEIASVVVRRYGKNIRSKWQKFKYIFETLKSVWIADDCLKKAIKTNEENINMNKIEIEDDLTIIHEKIRKYLNETFSKLVLYHVIVSRVSVFYQFVAMSILTRNDTTLTPEHYHDISLLFSCHEDVVSAEIPRKLQDLAKKIFAHTNLWEKFLITPSENCIEFLQTHTPVIYKEFYTFLEQQGHRSLREFELQAKPWGAEPEKLIDFIKHNVKTKNFGNDSSIKKNVIVELITPKDGITKKLLHFIMAKSRKAVARREATKSELSRSVNYLRKAYSILGQKLKTIGKIPNVDLIFHLSDYEISEIIQNSATSSILLKKALLRKRLYNKWDNLKFPEISHGIPIALENYINIEDGGLKEVKGTPVCMGEIEGRACVIHKIEDADQLQQGDILITYCTDTAWSLYFPIISGIVTELGGLISHGKLFFIY